MNPQPAGILSLRQAYKLVMANGSKGPSGRRRLRAPASVMAAAPSHKAVGQVFSAWIRRVQSHSKKHQVSEHESENYLLPELMDKLQERGQRRPTVFQQAAIFALHHGLGADELMPHLLWMSREEKRGTSNWIGRVNPLLTATNRNLPGKIEKILSTKPKIFDSQELASKAIGNTHSSKKGRKQDQNAMNAALQLLEEAGLARREIPLSRHSTGDLTTYAHASHPELKVSHYNYALDLIEKLNSAKGELSLSGLSLLVHGKRRVSGTFFKRKLKTLQTKAGLVEVSAGTKSNSPQSVKLSPKGSNLVKLFLRSGRKSFAELRQALS